MLTASPRRWRLAALLSLLLSLAALAWPRAAHSTGGHSLRFYGHGSSAPDLDRVKIRIDPAVPADVGATDFTIEVWLKAGSGNNAGAITPGANVNWINGNIFLDRDIYAAPAYGDFGLSLGAGRVAFGVETGQGARTIVGTSDLRDGAWHHVAVTRNATTGQMRLFVDGVQEASATGPTGDASYQDGRATSYPNSDPYLVLGAEKHDVGPAYPAFSGWLDELRLSTVIRYTGAFTRPGGPFTPDANTVALYHFDEGPAGACTGTVLDSSGAAGGPSHGQCRYGGSGTAGPVYSTDTPFGGVPDSTTTPSRTPTATRTATAAAGPTSTRTPTATPSAVIPITGPYRVQLPLIIRGGGSAAGDLSLAIQPAAGLNDLYLPVIMKDNAAAPGGFSLRFYGHGTSAPDLDRVKIRIDPAVPADVGGSFTLEFWMKASLGDNGGSVTCNANDGWITGNILFDRDVFGDGDFGDYGVALGNGRIGFGVNNGSTGTVVCGATNVATGAWRHVAVTRNGSTGELRVYVDGQLDGARSGPTGNLSYRDGRSTSWPNSDPFLVIAAEKHDAGSQFPSYNGLIDEVRLSNTLRYTGATYTVPGGPFTPDANTVALYHFDEGPAGACTGTVLDSSGAAGGPSHGQCRYGGSGSPGPVYSSDTPH